MPRAKGSGSRKKSTPGQRAAAKRRAKNRAVGAPDNAVRTTVQKYPFGLREVSWQVPVGRSVTNSRTVNPVTLRKFGIYKISAPTHKQGGYWGRG